MRSKYNGEIANKTETEWLRGNTSILYLGQLDTFSDDQLLRILQDLKAEFDELEASNYHQRGLIVPAFSFSMLAIVFVVCLCKKDKFLQSRLQDFEQKVSNENLDEFKKELVQLCREEYLSKNRKEESQLKADMFVTASSPPDPPEPVGTETPLRGPLLRPSVIYIPALTHNRVFDPSQEARPVTAGDIELAWKHKFGNKE